MIVTRHEKVERLAETGQNLCGGAFYSNAERIVAALENKDCDKLEIAFTVTIRATNKDDEGIGKFAFDNPSLVITKNQKYKDTFDDVLLNFIDDELNNMDKAMDEANGKEKPVKGVVIDSSRQLTTSENRQELVYRDEKKDKTYFAGQGLGDDAFMTFKGLPTDGSRHRYVNKALPVRTILQDAEDDLIAYALKKGWKRVEQETEKQGEQDTMKVERTLTEIVDPEDGIPCGPDGENGFCQQVYDRNVAGCCECEQGCKGKKAVFGNAASCKDNRACSSECPRLVKDESDFELKADVEEKTEFTPVSAELDNAEKLARLGLTAVKLIPEEKTIKSYDKEAMVFISTLSSPYKTKAATERDFDKLLTMDSHYQDIDAFSDWDVDHSKTKFFRGFEYAYEIRYRTDKGGWGGNERFNTEIQYENRLDELRRKMDHFEV